MNWALKGNKGYIKCPALRESTEYERVVGNFDRARTMFRLSLDVFGSSFEPRASARGRTA